MSKYIIILIPLFLYGCAQTSKEVEQNLLYEEDKFARKSITVKDYKDEQDC